MRICPKGGIVLSIRLNTDELRGILELFYTLSGIRIVVFDENHNELISYPEKLCAFCNEIRSVPELAEMCAESDNAAFEKCRSGSGEGIRIYKCHAGLVEATIPLKAENRTIGYIMFGQITDIKDKDELSAFVADINKKYGIDSKANGLKYRSRKQINAAAKLLEICTNYILLKELIAPANDRITRLSREYIEEHISEEIRISALCEYAGTSRTKLYEAFKADCGMGVAEYIRKRRLSAAYNMLKTAKTSVAEVSERVGFTDYNYFSRVFKNEYGASPHKLFNKVGTDAK